MSRIAALFRPPRFEDEEKTRQAFLLNIIVWALIALTILYFVYHLFSLAIPGRVLMQVIYVVILGAFLLILVRSGYVRSASIILIAAFWVFFTVTAWIRAGVHAQSFQIGYVLVISLGGLLFRIRGALIMLGLSLLSGGLMVAAEDMGFWSFKAPHKALVVLVISAILFPILCVLQYIAERLLRSALVQSQMIQAQYRNLIEHLPQRIFIKDLKSVYMSCNENYARDMGIQPEQIVGKDDFAFYPKELAEKYRADDRAVMESDAHKDIEEKYLVSNQERWVHTTKVPYRNYQGQVVGVLGIFEDITERKQAEKALQSSEERMRLLIDNAAEVVTVIQDGLIKFINRKCIDLVDYSPEELISQPFFGLVHHDDRQMVTDNYVKRLSGADIPTVYEFRVIHKSGLTKWVTVSVAMFNWEEKPAILGLLTDITERKRAEELLRESEEKYRFITDRMSDIVWILDTNLRPTYVSPSVLKVLGFTPEERLGQNLLQRVTTASAEKAQEILKYELQRDRERGVDPDRSLTLELENYHKDGSIVWMEQVVGFIRDGEGNVTGIHGVSRNVSERKRMEEALRASEAKYRLLAENATDVIWTVDMNLNVTYVSPSVYRVRGYTPEEVMAMKLTDQMTQDSIALATRVLSEELAVEAREDRDLKRSRKLDLEFFCKDGSIYWSEVNLTFIRDSEGKAVGILGVSRDITERKYAEEEKERLFEQVCIGRERLQSLSRQLVELQENERRDIARELHDQVGQNLTALGINLNIISSQLPAKSAGKVRIKLEDSMKLLEETAERIRDVMADLRPPLLDDYGLTAALRWYGQRFMERTGVATIVQGEEMETRLSPNVQAALFKIAQEALTNVARHSQAKQVIITLEEVSEGIRLSIADDGIGFDLTAHHSPGARPEWGLMIIRERAEAVGGHLSLKSTIGKGTQVVVEVARKN